MRKRHLYIGNLDRETAGDNKNDFLHSGDVLGTTEQNSSSCLCPFRVICLADNMSRCADPSKRLCLTYVPCEALHLILSATCYAATSLHT